MADKKFPRVIIFTTPSCSFCRSAKAYLRQKGVPFKDVDVSRDSSAARDMVRRSGQQGVPVLDIGGKVIVGFDRPKIDRLLGLR
jgi:glutaredoxin-like YruB-family protein